jgi:hypothetical protein
MTEQFYLIPASFTDTRCDTGNDGGNKCRHYHEQVRDSWTKGESIHHACYAFGRTLKEYSSEKVPIVVRCQPCRRLFGVGEIPAVLDRFDIPIENVTLRNGPAVPIPTDSVAYSRSGLRAVERPSATPRARVSGGGFGNGDGQ